MSIVRENPALVADKLVNGDRNADYGRPIEDFTKTAAFWSAILSKKLNKPIEPHEVALCMIGVKLSREANKRTFDNLVDICGYAITAQSCYEDYDLIEAKKSIEAAALSQSEERKEEQEQEQEQVHGFEVKIQGPKPLSLEKEDLPRKIPMFPYRPPYRMTDAWPEESPLK